MLLWVAAAVVALDGSFVCVVLLLMLCCFHLRLRIVPSCSPSRLTPPSKNKYLSPQFGVLLVEPGQTTDDEMLANSGVGSAAWHAFLARLGNRVSLAGHTGFDGGLDTKRAWIRFFFFLHLNHPCQVAVESTGGRVNPATKTLPSTTPTQPPTPWLYRRVDRRTLASHGLG